MAASKKQQKQQTDQAQPQPQVVPDPMSAVVVRVGYYRDGFRRLMTAAYLGSILIVALIVILIGYINLHVQRDRYFVSTMGGEIIQMTPLDEAGITRRELGDWLVRAATDAMSFGPEDYKRKLQSSAVYFTKNGWTEFTALLQQSGLIEGAESRQQSVSAKTTGQFALLAEGVTLQGEYFWRIQLPVSLTYSSGDQTRTASAMFDIVIKRVFSLEKPLGIGIEQWRVAAGK